MNFIKNIFENKIDEETHKQFKRFGKGNYENRAIVEMSVGKDLKIKTSFEYANEFVRLLANTIDGKTNFNGGIITTQDLKNLGLEFSNIKQFAGVKTYELNCEVSKETLLKIIDNFPDAVFCLSFSTNYGSLKTKVKSPKSAKPGKDDEVAKANYCTFVTSDLKLKKEFAFDVKDEFKKFRVSHDIIITDLVVPNEYKNDFNKARIYSKRKGKIIRKLEIDGKQIIKEKEFEV